MIRSGLRPLGIGEILDAAFRLYREHFGSLVLVAAVCGSVGLAADFLLPHKPAMVAGVAGGLLGLGALTWLSAEIVFGRPATPREALSFGVANGARVITVMLCTFVIFGLAGGLGGFVFVGLTNLARSLSRAAAVATGVLSGAGAIGGLWFLFVRYFAAYQVALLEREPHFLKRSALLAHGAFWKITVIWLVGFLVVMGPSFLIGFAGGFHVGYERATGGEAAAQEAEALRQLVVPVLGWLVQALTTPFSSALYVLLYVDQRVRKDGLDVAMAVSGLEVHTQGKPLAA